MRVKFTISKLKIIISYFPGTKWTNIVEMDGCWFIRNIFHFLAICRYLTKVMTQIWWSKFPLWPLFLLGNTVPSNNPPTILKDFNWSLLLIHYKYIYICDFKVMEQNIYAKLFLKCSTHKTTWSEIVNGAFVIFRVPNFNIEKYYGCYPSLIKLRYFHKKWKNLC